MILNIVVVDDEVEIADLIELYLQNEGFCVRKFNDGVAAMQDILKSPPDMAILDVMLPGIDGFSICMEIRKKYTFPVIMVTAKVEDIDKINGLVIGADDYIAKPFNPLELVARVKAQFRRSTRYNTAPERRDAEKIDFLGLVMDSGAYECTLYEKDIKLTPIEFSILWYLCQNRGKVINAEELFRVIWGEKYFENNNNTVMVHIRHIREKMGEKRGAPKFIKTVWGVGYKVDENA